MPPITPAAVVRAYGGGRVRFAAALGVAVLAAAAASSIPGFRVGPAGAVTAARPPARTVATVTSPLLPEISGCAVSAQTRGGGRILWLHNDSGEGPKVYAVDARTGRVRATFVVTGAEAQDWEDIAVAKGKLYIGDIGDNAGARSSITIYRVDEPKVPAKPVSAEQKTVASVALRMRYPDGPHNAEALMVHPTTGDAYIVTKADDGRSAVFVLRGAATAPAGDHDLEKVADLTLSTESLIYPNQITAGDISPSGDRIVLRTYQYLYVYRPSTAGGFDSAWTVVPTQVNAPFLLQAESLCFTPDGRYVLTTQEGLPAPLVEIDLRRV